MELKKTEWEVYPWQVYTVSEMLSDCCYGYAGHLAHFLLFFCLFFILCYDLGSLSLASPLCLASRGCVSPFWTCI
jgi:hypothetical protein